MPVDDEAGAVWQTRQALCGRPYTEDGQLLWQHVGAGAGSEAALAEGVLYYGGQAGPSHSFSYCLLAVHQYTTDLS